MLYPMNIVNGNMSLENDLSCWDNVYEHDQSDIVLVMRLYKLV